MVYKVSKFRSKRYIVKNISKTQLHFYVLSGTLYADLATAAVCVVPTIIVKDKKMNIGIFSR